MEFYNVVHNKKGYWEARNSNNEFVLSADTASEAWRELEAEFDYDMY